MENNTNTPLLLIKNKWFRLGAASALAFMLVALVLLMPILVSGRGQTLALPADTALPLPFKVETVSAFGGISVTKQVISATVDQGQILTYTLRFENNSGSDLGAGIEQFVISDTIPANTGVPVTVFASADGNWATSFNPATGEVRWLWSVALFGSITDTYATVVTYSVQVNKPLPDQLVLTNAAGDYIVYRINPDASVTILDIGATDIDTIVNAPEWEISKTADPSPSVEPGDTLTYTLTVTNTGHLPTTGSYTITDELPNDTNFVSASAPGTFDGTNVTWVLSDPVGIDEVFTVTYSVTVTEFLPQGTQLVNQTYSITGGEVFSEAFGSPVIVTVNTPVTLTLTKLDDPDPVQAGALLDYTILVTNELSSKGPASGVVVTDTIPANTSLIDAGFLTPTDGVTSTDGTVITWTVTTPDPLPRGETANLFMTVQVTSPLTNNTILTNDLYGVAVSNTVVTILDGTPATTTVESLPDLTITKVGLPAIVSAGEQLTYTIRYTNTGNANATGVVITDTFPLSTSYASSAGSPTPIISASIPGGWSWELPPVAGEGGSGVITLTLNVESPQDTGTVLTNTATIVANEPVSDTTTATNTIVSTPTLEISKTGSPEPVEAGGQITYTIRYTNTGNANAVGVVITDVFPLNTTFNSEDGTPFVAGVPTGNGRQWTIGTVPGNNGGGIITLTLDVLSPQANGTVMTNVVTIGASQPTTDTAVATNTIVSTPTLEITKIGLPEPAAAGGQIAYTIRYTNTGNANAAGVVITDIFPLSTTFNSETGAPVVTGTAIAGGRRWNIGPVVGNNGGGVITLTLNILSPQPAGTILTDVVTIADNQANSDTFTATNTITSTPVLDIFKVGLPNPVTAGGQITYTIRYTNSGNADAVGTVITDIFPANTSFVNATPLGASILAGTGRAWSIGTVPGNNGGGVITLTLAVSSPQAAGTILTDLVTIADNQGNSDSFTATNTITSTPLLQIRKTDNPDPVRVGSVLTYTILYSNTGNADATGVTITDVLDNNVSYIGDDSGGVHDGSPTGGLVTWTGLSAPADGSPQTIQLTVMVDPALPNNSILVNNFGISSNLTSITTTGSITTLVQVPALAITKIVSPTGPFVRAGDNIQYTIRYTNTGLITAANVSITDTFPVSVTNLISSSAEAVLQDGTPPTLVWLDTEVPPNGSGTILISGQVITSPWAATGGLITNDVIVKPEDAFTDTAAVSIPGQPGLPATINLVPIPPTTQVGNTIVVSATVRDAFGNPVFNGTPITFTVSPIGNITSPGLTTNGVATANLNSTVAGTTTVTAQAAGASGAITATTVATFTPGAVASFTLQATTPQTAGVPFSLTIRAIDAFGNLVTNFNQAVTIDDDTGTIIPAAATLVNGITVTNVTVFSATSPAFDTITATNGSAVGTVDVEILPGPPAVLTLTANPTATQICQTAILTTLITDQFGNPVSTQPVTLFASPPVSATLTPASGSTNGAGLFTSVFTGNSAGSVSILGSNPPGGPTDQITMTVTGPPVPTNLTLTVAPNPLLTGGNVATVTATVVNCLGPAAGEVITFTLSDTTLASFASTFTATTNASGVATITLVSNSTPVTGTLIITGQAGPAIGSVPLDVVLPPAPSLTIVKTANPASGTTVRPGSLINYTLLVTNVGTDPANNVVITDILPPGVTFVTGSSSSGSTFAGGSTTTVTTPTLGVGQTLQADIQVSVTAATSGTTLANTATTDSDETTPVTSTLVTHQVVTNTLGVFLPILIKDTVVTPPPTPTPTTTPPALPSDLRVASFSISPANPTSSDQVVVTVVVENAGIASTGEGFWVDFYIDPIPVPNPSLGDKRWDSLGSAVSPKQGIAWAISTPLEPGQSIVLTSDGSGGGLAPSPAQTVWSGSFVSGTNDLYVYVDSYDTNLLPEGDIVESDETNNLGQITGLGVSGTTSTVDFSRLPDPAQLPPRMEP